MLHVLPFGAIDTAARYIEIRTRNSVTKSPARSPPSIGIIKLIHEEITNNPTHVFNFVRETNLQSNCVILPDGIMNCQTKVLDFRSMFSQNPSCEIMPSYSSNRINFSPRSSRFTDICRNYICSSSFPSTIFCVPSTAEASTALHCTKMIPMSSWPCHKRTCWRWRRISAYQTDTLKIQNSSQRQMSPQILGW